eukprot:gnl/MRDRNA2_/MRDRNA2_20492_c0_seq1.p1 gnl/MRDRNA2_/MRDRNA2_20492_c0~~gnl/MRDRNA2_/MRDRNA2_20492_c0_seq1.p1  ORF type:complete len:281 (+),score=54.58 gnl/MRDRNA2_/MRDRNA2_20492_c0_seq1:67-909(+)
MDLSGVLDFLDDQESDDDLRHHLHDGSGGGRTTISWEVPRLNPGAPPFLPLNLELHEFNAVQPPEPKSQLNAEAADFIPTLGGMASLQAEADAWAMQQRQPQQLQVDAGVWAIQQPVVRKQRERSLSRLPNQRAGELPFATDEEWEQRFTKRKKEVDTIKSLPSYRMYLELVPTESRIPEDPHHPRTPDPRDRTVSKRMWKWNVERWRLQLKGQYGTIYSRMMLLQLREINGLGSKCSSDCVVPLPHTLHWRELSGRAELIKAKHLGSQIVEGSALDYFQ